MAFDHTSYANSSFRITYIYTLFNKGCFGHWANAHWEAIVWRSLKRSILLCSVCPNAQCPIANDQLPKQPVLN